jgi:uncharacterized protein YgiB involved in biofilm formation
MAKQITAIAFSILLIFAFYSEVSSRARLTRNERFVIYALQTINAAQATFQATGGAGNYGTLNRLAQENLIDSVLATGYKYGYYFVLTSINRTPTTPARFYVTATPRRYQKDGRLSFYIDETGTLRGADKNGNPATVNDPVIEVFTVASPIPENERWAIRNVRTLHSAQITYQATVGNGQFAATLTDLRDANFINNYLATGTTGGYLFRISRTIGTSTSPATFTIRSVPTLYGTTGIRSFFVDTSGVLRGADKNGAEATANDPPIDECLELNNSYENCAISDLRTLSGAQATYQATIGNGTYETLNQLYAANLINQGLASGTYHGYIFSCIVIAPTVTSPAAYKTSAVPQNYGAASRRSFYVDESGVIRGADKNGKPADENDPPV